MAWRSVALREAIKVVYNDPLQGQPTGAGRDGMLPCHARSAERRALRTATSNADQGTTNVDLTYVFTACDTPRPTRTRRRPSSSRSTAR